MLKVLSVHWVVVELMLSRVLEVRSDSFVGKAVNGLAHFL